VRRKDTQRGVFSHDYVWVCVQRDCWGKIRRSESASPSPRSSARGTTASS
jgi:hypothetical protein